MSRTAVLSDEAWARIEPLLPPLKGATGRPMQPHRTLVEGSIYEDKRGEPDDRAIGRSRGGLTTKTHALVDGRRLPLVLMLTTGQAGDWPALPVLLAQLQIPRCGPGRP